MMMTAPRFEPNTRCTRPGDAVTQDCAPQGLADSPRPVPEDSRIVVLDVTSSFDPHLESERVHVRELACLLHASTFGKLVGTSCSDGYGD